MKIYFFTDAEPVSGAYVQDGDLIELTWGFKVLTAEMIETHPETFSGFQNYRRLMRQKTLFGERMSRGDYIPEPIEVGWRVVDQIFADFLRDAYRRRSLLILEDNGETTIARLVKLRLTPLRGYGEYWKCDATFYPAAVFKVYRSLDYGATYQLASTSLSVNHFEDTGFVWNGRLKYRIEYSSPEAPFVPEVEKEEGIFISAVKDYGVKGQNILPLGIEGSYNPWDFPTFINGFGTTTKDKIQFLITPPPPSVSQIVGLILVNGDYVEGIQFAWDEPSYPPAVAYPVLAITGYTIYKGAKVYDGAERQFSTGIDPGAEFIFHSVNEHGEGEGVSIIASSPADLLKAVKDNVSFSSLSETNYNKKQFYILRGSEDDEANFESGFGILNGVEQKQYTAEKNYNSEDNPTFSSGTFKVSYQLSGSTVIYL